MVRQRKAWSFSFIGSISRGSIASYDYRENIVLFESQFFYFVISVSFSVFTEIILADG